MLTKSKIALSFAVVLGATLVSLMTQALAQNPYPGHGRYEPGFRNGHQRWNGVREERSRVTPPRWIDDPRSPGG